MVTVTTHAAGSAPVGDRRLEDDEYDDVDQMLRRLAAATALGSIAGSLSPDGY
jgi:hypothetical protein